MGLAYVVVLIICAAFTGRVAQDPFTDGDLFWQKHLGEYVLAHHALPTTLGTETFAAPGVPWTPQEWLLGIAAFLAISHGALWVLAIAIGFVLAAALLISAVRAQRFGGTILPVAIATVLLALDLEGSFGIRAQVLAWPLFALLLFALDLEGPAVFTVLAVIAAWANVHASVMLALPIVWIDALTTLFRRGIGDAETRRRLALALLAPLATLATPLGVRLPLYAIMLVQSPIRHSIDEWQPLALHHAFFWSGGAPMIALIALCIRRLWRERPRDLICGVVLLIMSIGAVRNAALLGIVLCPLAARAIDMLFERFAWWPVNPIRDEGPRWLAIGGSMAVAVLVFFVTWKTPLQKDAWVPPVATFDRLAASPQDHRVFCYDFSICSIALDHPNLQVFMDGRADPYPLSIWNDFNIIRGAHRDWANLLDVYKIDIVLAKRGDPLDKALTKRRGWTALPKVDRCCQAFVRPPPV